MPSRLCFAVFSDGKPVKSVDLAGAYMVGSEDAPLRAEISWKAGLIHCSTRAPGPAALVLLWEVPGVGKVMLESSRLLERKRPYMLTVELARGQLMRLLQKVEEWGLAEYDAAAEAAAGLGEARELLIKALQAEDHSAASDIGQQALEKAVQAGEQLTLTHAEALRSRRRPSPQSSSKGVIGCSVLPALPIESLRKPLSAAADFVSLPTVWRDIEPNEQAFQWEALDTWVQTLAKHRFPIKAGPIVSFSEQNVPDWLFMWEHDFDTLRDLAYEHARRLLNRYGQYVKTWTVISGIHGQNCLTFHHHEQLMELTRMAAALARQAAPQASLIVDVVAPWGEYYARNQCTIPPLHYADWVVQSGIAFDAFGLQFRFGPPEDGSFARALFQISSVIDQFAKMGKPIHITAALVPSSTAAPKSTNGQQDGEPAGMVGGYWRAEWSEQIQAEFLKSFMDIALSKPFVESVVWDALVDHPESPIPHGGLLRADLEPKPAYERLLKARNQESERNG
jgi:predicted RNase H-like HicB family nuclease